VLDRDLGDQVAVRSVGRDNPSRFQIPVTDVARARAFYERICRLKLRQMEAGPAMTMCVFPVDPPSAG